MLVEPTAATLAQAYGQIEQLGKATGHSSSAASARRADEAADRGDRRLGAAPEAPITVYHELEPDLYSATSKTFIGRIYAMLGLKDIADAADKTGSGYPQLSAEYIVAADPQLVVARRHDLLRADRGEVRQAAGLGRRSRRSRTGTSRGRRRHRVAAGARGSSSSSASSQTR